MNSQCAKPDLQMGLLAATRAGDPIGPAESEHLDACEACQLATERLRRMVAVWIADPPEHAAIAAAEVRFLAKQHEPAAPSWRDPIPFAAMGAAFGVVLLLIGRSVGTHTTASRPSSIATSGTHPVAADTRPGPAVPETTAPETGEARAAVLTRPHVESPRGTIPLTDGVKVELQAGEVAQVALADGHAAVLHGPCSVEFWSSPTEVGGWRLAYQAPTTAAAIALDPEPEAPPSAIAPGATSAEPAAEVAGKSPAVTRPHDGPSAEHLAMGNDSSNPAFEPAWERAAEALRRDDFGAADQAFGELGRASDPATRDAARLARAQLWMAHGRGAAVRPVLRDLASTGATALVRQRAAEFLSREAR